MSSADLCDAYPAGIIVAIRGSQTPVAGTATTRGASSLRPTRVGLCGRATHDFYPVIKRAGAPRIWLYDLRHTTASLLIELNVDPKRAALILGAPRRGVRPERLHVCHWGRQRTEVGSDCPVGELVREGHKGSTAVTPTITA